MQIKVDPNSLIVGDEHTTQIAYDFWTGIVTSQTDANQKTTTTSYHNHLLGSIDPFGRPGTVTAPLVGSTVNGATTNHQRRVETRYHDSQRMVEVWSDLNAGGDMKLRSRATADKLGRTVKTETSENGSAYTISTQAVYHQAGRIVMSRNPHRGAGGESTDGWTRTTADDIGRVVEVATFNGAAQPPISGGSWNGRVTTDYKGVYTEVTDQAGKLRRSLVDGLGRLIEIHEPNEFGSLGSITSPVQKTSYLYDVLDNLIQVNQGSQQRLFTYDSLSRLRTAKNPEQLMQATTYNYDDAGNLTSKLNPNSTSVMFTYDGLNRVKTKTLSTGEAYTYNYDTGANGKGRMVSVVRQGGSDGYYYDGYDSLGRVTASRQVTTAGGATRTYTMSYGYDLAGDMTKEVYPSGKEYRMSYDDAGRISSASRYISGVFDKTYASGMSYTPHGAMSQMSLGNNTRETMAYNPRLQVTQIEMRKVAGNELLLGLDYGYAPTTNNGNIQSQTIRIGHQGATTTISQSYVYDSLNRLQSATETAGWNQSYGFDRYGNRAVTAGYVPTPVLTPQSLGEFNALTNRISGCVYDTSGNMLQDQAQGSYQYDAENRQVIYNSGAASYEYDGDGRRVKKVVGGETTVFVYNAVGQLVAEYTSGSGATNGTSYLTSDHLGSTRLVTDSSGNVRSRRDYLPFGEELGASIGSRTVGMGYDQADGIRQRFTGYERDIESGLDFAQARYYSSAQGRFTSPDEFAGGPQEFWILGSGDPEKQALPYANINNPQSLNKYQYGFNNPLRFVDPDGHQSSDDPITKFLEWIGLYTPTPTPRPEREAILNQRIPGQNGMTLRDMHQIQRGAIGEAAEATLKVLEATPAGFAATALGRKLGMRSDSEAAFAAVGALIPLAEETFRVSLFKDALNSIEKVAGFKIYGIKGLVGETFNRNIFLFEAEKKGAAPLSTLVNALTTEARQAGAKELRIIGTSVVNPGLFNEKTAARYGFTFRKINDETIELVKKLD